MKKTIIALTLIANSFATFAQLKVISNGNVGIGVSNPQRKLHMNDELLLGPKTGVPYAEGIKFTRSQNFPTNPAEWAFDTDGNGFNIWKPFPSTNSGNFKFFIADATGNTGIGTGTPAYKLDVNGQVRATQYLTSSDEKYKTNIKPLKSTIDKIMSLTPKTYDFTPLPTDQSTAQKSMPKSEQKEEVQKNRVGLIAQEVQKIFPNLVYADSKGYLSIDYIGLIPYLIQSLKDQNKEVQELKSQLQSCCALNTSSSRVANPVSEIEKQDLSSPKLEQNNPNPFNQQTQIAYYIPENCNNTSLHIYDLNGIELKAIDINQKGKGNITIDANSLKAGMYLYTLICDGKEIATKKMILTSK